MPVTVIVNNTPIAYPDDGDEPGWGGQATLFATEVAEVLNNIQGTDDIPETTFNIANNNPSPMDIVGFIFNPATVRSAVLNYSIYRTTDAAELAEKGSLEIVYKNGGPATEKWTIGRVFFGDDAGVEITMTDAGQGQYTSSSIAGNNYSGQIVFEATVTQQ